MSDLAQYPRVIAYYGDDFTGSTDVMEALTLNGLPTVLFLTPPGPEQLSRFSAYRAVGIAGTSRSRDPEWMNEHLPPVFRCLKELGAPLVHYKICSTFDSSPRVGSIGRAIEIGRDIFASRYVPLVVGAPVLGRYTVFGNHFAVSGGEVYRLDRHPTMVRHPVTPMDEADLRLHLRRQADLRIELIDILALRSPPERLEGRFDETLERRPDVVLFDVLDESSLPPIGRLIWRRRETSGPFVVGSSGLEYALAAYWRASGELPPASAPPRAKPVDRLIVVSGSCAPVTAQQIRTALACGFEGVRLDVPAVARG
ncbi:MAG TPA: four-carbon acid sugar kinase family protein, partial [Thermopetrobacter sp.]|nr:four-carbon acid sugar kinase family protein [Thermopetrobacter sp.]